MFTLLSCLYYIYFFVTAALLSLVLLVISPFDRQKSLLHHLTSLWGYHFLWLNPKWVCRFEGAQYLEPGKNYVIVANHQSLADIFVLSGVRHHFKWVSKDSLLKIPFFGWNMRLNNYVTLKRGDRQSIKEMMANCKKWINRGVSIMMFPEGTRSDDGRMGEFRDGSFRLALDCGVPLVPIVIAGTRDIISKHGKTLNFSAHLTIKILPPVFPGQFEGSPGKMRDHVHELMNSALSQLLQERLETSQAISI